MWVWGMEKKMRRMEERRERGRKKTLRENEGEGKERKEERKMRAAAHVGLERKGK